MEGGLMEVFVQHSERKMNGHSRNCPFTTKAIKYWLLEQFR